MDSSDTSLKRSLASGSLRGMTGYAQVVTFIGAGGKTTCLRTITREIDSAGYRVIATTTTKVYPEEEVKSWKNSDPPPYEQDGACFWYVDVIEENGKWKGPSVQAVDAAISTLAPRPSLRIPNLARHLATGTIQEFPLSTLKRGKSKIQPQRVFWVIEGDGARGLKLKCWESHEPQIPQRSDCAVLVLDGGLWGTVLQAGQVHRPAACRELLGQVWDADKAWRYFMKSPVFAPRYGQMSWVILLNMKAPIESYKPVLDLYHRWVEIQREVNNLEYPPKHLRIAAGDAQAGKLQWLDLW